MVHVVQFCALLTSAFGFIAGEPCETGISEIDLTFWFYHVLCIHVAAPLVKKHSTIIIIILLAMQAEGLLFSSFQVP